MNPNQDDRSPIIIEEIADWLFSILVTILTTSLLLSWLL